MPGTEPVPGEEGVEGVGQEGPLGLGRDPGRLGRQAQAGGDRPQPAEDGGPPISGVPALEAEGPLGVGPRGEAAGGVDTSDSGQRVDPGGGGPALPTALSDRLEGGIGRPGQKVQLPTGVNRPGLHQLGHLGGGKGPFAQFLLGARQCLQTTPEGQGGPGLTGRDPLQVGQQHSGVAVACVPPHQGGLDPGGEQGLARHRQPFQPGEGTVEIGGVRPPTQSGSSSATTAESTSMASARRARRPGDRPDPSDRPAVLVAGAVVAAGAVFFAVAGLFAVAGAAVMVPLCQRGVSITGPGSSGPTRSHRCPKGDLAPTALEAAVDRQLQPWSVASSAVTPSTRLGRVCAHSPAFGLGAGPVFDPFDPHWAGDPFPLYAELRERAPISRSELGFWVVARHADCLAILRDRRASSDSLNVADERLPHGLRTPSQEEDPMAAAMLEMRPFLFRDPPDHTRLRGLVSKAFTPKVVESLRLEPSRWSTNFSTQPWRTGESI